MTHERRLKVARKIVADGIMCELDIVKVNRLTDMAPEDREAIIGMVEQIATAAQFVEFAFPQTPQDIWPRSTDPSSVWARSS